MRLCGYSSGFAVLPPPDEITSRHSHLTGGGGAWKRGASNAGYHYLGYAKTFALMGKAFAETVLEMN
jgi:hypothetical protein